jgi:hypothetical protein
MVSASLMPISLASVELRPFIFCLVDDEYIDPAPSDIVAPV